jgi:glyoxylase-like metal-dependent hydrolase (beta-lactamase superfamily II)
MRKTLDNVFTSADGSVIVDKDFLVVVDAGCEEKTVKDFMKLSLEEKKPISHIFLTHFHWDHAENTKIFRKHFPNLVVIGHENNYKAKKKIKERKTMNLGSFNYTVILTPGHSPRMDDICILLEELGVIFVGDLCQPQGNKFEAVDFVTSVPYFHDGKKYIESLKKILKMDFKFMITGHGKVYNEKHAFEALEITLKTVEKMKHAAINLYKNNPKLSERKLADMIFEEVSKQRNFHGKRRLSEDYHEIDMVGLRYWVKYAKRCWR